MSKYAVTIEARIRKTLTVEAADEGEATENAHAQFSVASTDEPEDYDEDTISVEEIKE